MLGKPRFWMWMALLVTFLGIGFFPSPGVCGTPPEAGSTLPDFEVPAPVLKEDREYLGIGDAPKFTVDQVKTPFVLIEIVGVFCPQCHIQAPLFNTLYQRINKNSDLEPRIRMMAIAAGATPMEVDYMRKQFKIPYPLTTDTTYAIHKLLGEPGTPFTMIVDKNKKIVFTHLGVIKDTDKFLQEIQKLVQ